MVTVNRPEVSERARYGAARGAAGHLEDLAATSCGVIIVTGAGDRSFIAGADIKEMDGKTPLEARGYSELGQEIAHKLE